MHVGSSLPISSAEFWGRNVVQKINAVCGFYEEDEDEDEDNDEDEANA